MSLHKIASIEVRQPTVELNRVSIRIRYDNDRLPSRIIYLKPKNAKAVGAALATGTDALVVIT